MSVVAERPGALGMLLIEEGDAWRDYLEATQNQSPIRYEEVEPWAFSRLCQRLKAIHARRTVLLEAVSQDDGA